MKKKRRAVALLSLVLSMLLILSLYVPVMGYTPPSNLVVNPSFEDGLTGWRSSGGGAWTDSGGAKSGVSKFHMSGLANGRWLMTEEIAAALIDPARTYRLSVWIKISAAQPESTVNLKFGASAYVATNITYSGFGTADCFTIVPVKDLTTTYQQFQFTCTGAQLLTGSPDSLMVGVIADGAMAGPPYVYYDDFELIEQVYTITATTPDNRGTITGETIVPAGGSSTMTITPLPHCEIADVKVNGVSQGPISSYTFENVTEDQTIEATFRVLTENLLNNPSFEDGITGWRSSGGGAWTDSWGAKSGVSKFHMSGLADGRWLMTEEIAAVLIDPARTYRLSVWIKISEDQPESAVNLKFGASVYAAATTYSGFGTADCFTIVPVKDLTTTYQQFQFTCTGAQLLTGSPANLMVGVVADGAMTGPYVYYDDFELIEYVESDDAKAFRINHNEILAKTPVTLSLGDGDALTAAFTQYDQFSSLVKLELSDEYALLVSLQAAYDNLLLDHIRQILIKQLPTEYAVSAADVDGSESIDIVDLLVLKRRTLI